MDNKLLKQIYNIEKTSETESPTGIHAEFEITVCNVNTTTNGMPAQVSQENSSIVIKCFISKPLFLNGCTTIHKYLSNAIISVTKDDVSLDAIDATAATLHTTDGFQNTEMYMSLLSYTRLATLIIAR